MNLPEIQNPPPVSQTEDLSGSPTDRPLVSIITAVFNGARFLEQTICSVVHQTYANIEFIIIDGGSTDGTLAIIERYHAHIARWLSEPDRGVYDAWNKGVDVARGQWIAFLGSDDVLYPYAVENYIQYIQQLDTPGLDYVSSKVQLVDDDLKFLRTIGKPWSWKAFSKYNNLAHVGSFHNRRLFDQFGRYDYRYKIAGDYEFLIRSGENLNAAFMDDVTVKMRTSGISDNIKALSETRHVKIHSGGRNRVLSYLEYGYYVLRYGLKRLVPGWVN